MRCSIFIFVGLLAFSACSLELFDSEMRSNEGFVIRPYSQEHAVRNGSGFVVTIERDLAIKLGAPDGEKFKEMLEKRLAEERMRGNHYCPYGYDIVVMRRFKHYYTTVSANCRRA